MWGGRQSSGDIRPTADAPLVSPPVALAIDVFARILAEVGRADDEDLETLWPGLVASPRAGRDAYRIPFLEFDDLVVDFHPPAPAQDHVHLLLLRVRVAVRKAIAGRDALVAQGAFIELERLGRCAELQVGRAVELRAEVLQILLDVPEREGHGAVVKRCDAAGLTVPQPGDCGRGSASASIRAQPRPGRPRPTRGRRCCRPSRSGG